MVRWSGIRALGLAGLCPCSLHFFSDWEKQIKKIDDAEDKRKNQNHAGVLLGRKIATASHPLQNLSIPYAGAS